MRLKAISSVGALSLAIIFSACGGAATNTTNTTNKPANAPANTTNTNTTANKPAETNTTANSAAPAAAGDVVKIDEAGVMMTIPKGFKYSKDGEDIVVQTEDEGVDIRFTVPKDGDYNKIITDAAAEIDNYLKDVKVVDKGSKIDINGMEGTSLSGTATNDGEPVNWDLTIINAPKKPVLANIYAEKTSLDKHINEVDAFLKSVKKQ